LFSTVARSQDKPRASHDWPVSGGQPENMHYSKLAQINRANVKSLAVAWSFDTGEPGGLQTSPIIVGEVLYGITPTQKIFALGAATGSCSGNSTPESKERSRHAVSPIGPAEKISEFSSA